ncbi:uncharacterized protein LOC144704358 [Wolffia australiana]
MSIPVASRRPSRRAASESNSVNGKIIQRTDAMPTSQSSVILGRQSTSLHPNSPINVEEIDDDVQLLSSSRHFHRIRPRRNRHITVILDDELDLEVPQSGTSNRESFVRPPSGGHNRHKVPSTRITLINSETPDKPGDTKRRRISPSSEPPKEPSFTCNICWGTLLEETSTTCGHIFCLGCIKAAIQAQKKCPTCRRALTLKHIHRIYLPVAK